VPSPQHLRASASAESSPASVSPPAPAALSGSTAAETKKLRSDHAEQIRCLPLEEFQATRTQLLEELKCLKGVDGGWCHEAGGVIRTKDQHIYEVSSKDAKQSKRAVAWSYVAGIAGGTLHAAVCLLCFAEVCCSCVPYISPYVT